MYPVGPFPVTDLAGSGSGWATRGQARPKGLLFRGGRPCLRERLVL